MPPTRLRCDHQDQPLLVDSLRPWLSWWPPRDCAAVAARIEVAGDRTGDSGWLDLDGPGLVWPGPPLQHDQALRWRVRLRDGGGRESDWSAWSDLATGPDPAAWPAEWLQPPRAPSLPLLRCACDLDLGGIVAATWYLAPLGVPVLSVNGTTISEPGLADYQQDPRFRVEVRAWTVPLDLLRRGTNVLGLQLAGGFHERCGHGPAAVSGWLDLRREDGSRQRIGCAASDWRWHTGPVRGADCYDGETVDERQTPPDWDRPEGLGADGAWQPVPVGPAPAGRLVAAAAPLPGVVAEHPLRLLSTPHESCRIYDAGGSIAGGVRLRATGRRGKVLTLRHAEELDETGRLLIRGNRQALATDRLTLGGGPAIWQPRFVSHGFRYLEIASHGEWAEDLALSALAYHDRAEPQAAFACSHPGLSALFGACVTTFRQNLVGMLRDCPQRDERLGWLGDAHAIVPAVLRCVDAAAGLRRWCGLIADTQDPISQHRVAAMAPMEPLHMSRYASTSLPPREALPQADSVYTAAGTLLVGQFTAATGDPRLAAEAFPAIRAHLSGWARRPDWPLIDASSHGDHAAIPALADGPATPKPLVAAAVLLQELRCALDLARRLGADPGDLPGLERQLGDAVREYYAAAFADPASSQGTLTIGLDLDLVDAATGAAALRERLQRDGMRIATGIILTGPLLRVLTRHGLLAEAWQLVTRAQPPGWLWMLEQGPGTLHENLVDTWGFVSRNQPALGVVADWLLEAVLGLRPAPDDRDGRSWILQPPALPDLQHAEGSVPTPWGPIRASWRRGGEGVVHHVDAPASVSVRVPGSASVPAQTM